MAVKVDENDFLLNAVKLAADEANNYYGLTTAALNAGNEFSAEMFKQLSNVAVNKFNELMHAYKTVTGIEYTLEDFRS